MSRCRRRLSALDSYEVVGQPVVTSTRLCYRPWIEQAVAPYNATRLPAGTIVGLWDALQQARLEQAKLDQARLDQDHPPSITPPIPA